jgi:hypothetical protein
MNFYEITFFVSKDKYISTTQEAANEEEAIELVKVWSKEEYGFFHLYSIHKQRNFIVTYMNINRDGFQVEIEAFTPEEAAAYTAAEHHGKIYNGQPAYFQMVEESN